MIKQIITVIVLIIVAVGLFTLAKTITPAKAPEVPVEQPQGKLSADSTPVGATSDIENVTWIWTETIANNDTSIIPKKTGAFSITLSDGKMIGKTDCNSFFGSYQIGSDGVISFGQLGSTMMLCEGSQERIFTDFISKSSHYTLDLNKNLVLLLDQDSGSVMFKKAESKDLTLGIGESGNFGVLNISLDKIIQDSRCPIDVQCIQAGAVSVEVTVSTDKTFKRTLTSNTAPEIFGGYKVSIVGVEPSPKSTKQIADKEYKITFHVEK